MAISECNCKWSFSIQSEATQDVGPNNAAAEHFRGTPYPSLIRESIQNSLDVVKDPSQPVRMEFKFKKIREGGLDNFLKLRNHIKGVLDYYGQKAEAEYRPMLEIFDNKTCNQTTIDYIKVSDYNTKGMDYKPNDTDSPFYAFVRAIGVTVKSDAGSGGSFGFGKSAYFAMSPIHTVLVSSMTEDGKTFFEGASTLCTHKMRGSDGIEHRYTHYGFYDNHDGERPSTGDEIPNRFKREEPGTDIMVMGIDGSEEAKNIAIDEMIEATLRNFWMSILQRKLEVTIEGVEITADSIDDLMRKYFPEIIDRNKSISEYNPRPYFEAVKNAEASKQYIKFSAYLYYLGDVVLYMYKNKDARDSVIHMRKQGMYIYRDKKYSTSYGYSAVFVCVDNLGNERLKKMEDPSHSKWEANRDKTNGKAIKKEIEDFIAKCLREAFVNDQGGPLGITGLEDYLFVPEEILASEEDNSGNPFFGTPDSTPLEEGLTPTSEITADPVVKPSTDDSIGNVVVHTPPKQAVGSDEGNLGGHKRQAGKKKRKGDGGSRDKNAFTEAESDSDGEFLENVPVDYRVIAETKNGDLIHTIIIHSDYDVANGEIEIIVGGEDKDEEVDIIHSSVGTPNGNLITGISLSSTERNTIEVQFSDKMKHVIKLTAYEFK